MNDVMIRQREEHVLSVNEVACVAEVPVKYVYRIIRSDLLSYAVKRSNGRIAILSKGLVGVKLAYDTAEILTTEGRRQLIRRLLDHPEADTVREGAVSIDIQPMKSTVRQNLTALEKAKGMVEIDSEVLSGTPCFRGTRIPVYHIAWMVANGDEIPAILEAYPRLNEEQVEAAILYAKAYPFRGRWKRRQAWQEQRPISSSKIAFEALSGSA
ncbi:MAG: DUF433 domain-containing protein [Gemmatimonadetes bacterium]|nr:DUF433 domain-containing protein [Gemmatimonadota bacterium]MXY84087.1 DUF433 domain-containing protein [Gemmatimonadota bacterium]MYB70002.1 DUF433 domain-containing protein [Gemmatimonadota bacterium]